MSKAIKVIIVILCLIGLLGHVGYRYTQEAMLKPIYVDIPQLNGTIAHGSIKTPDGHRRVFEYYIPSTKKDSLDIIYALHGSTSSGPDMRKQFAYEWDLLAEEHGFIVVYPTGFDNHWNDCRGSADYQANIQNIDDLHFLQLTDSLIVSETVSSVRRRFVTGFSNGGHFCFKLAMEAPDWINGIAVISANLPMEENRDCGAANQFIPTMIINGTTDRINPYEGGLVSIRGNDSRGTVHSSMETMAYFTGLGSCDSEPSHETLDDADTNDDSTIETYTWLCDSGIVGGRLYQVNNGGHTLPHPKNQLVPILGNTNRDIVLAKNIWQFFDGIN